MASTPWPRCGGAQCPVPPPDQSIIAKVATVDIKRGEVRWRGHDQQRPPHELVPGLGSARFTPLPGLHHTYVGATRTVAILESALHEASGPGATILLAALRHNVLSLVELRRSVTVADLRDDQLEHLGLERSELVTRGPMHDPCTRAWAAAILRAHSVDGIVWHSRQADLHAQANPGGLLADVLHHAPVEVAVLWAPPNAGALLAHEGTTEPLVENGRPARVVLELSELIRVPIE